MQKYEPVIYSLFLLDWISNFDVGGCLSEVASQVFEYLEGIGMLEDIVDAEVRVVLDQKDSYVDVFECFFFHRRHNYVLKM